MSSRRLQRNLALAAVTSFVLGASSVQCGSSNGGNSFTAAGGRTGTGTSNGGSTSTASMGSASGGSSSTLTGGNFLDVQTADYSADQFYATDPPPLTCDGGGTAPPPPGGTPECPDDKNLPGCPCVPDGGATTAACWTGLRKDRDHGDCKDGVTTCMMNSESTYAWGPCNGEVLPVSGAVGKSACQCFSSGHWDISNLDPCFVTDGSGNVTEAISTDPTTGQCPSDFSTAPATWANDTLTVDCAGNYTLCYTIKAGNPKMPLPTDCTVAQVCVTAMYPGPMDGGAPPVVSLDPLPGWITNASQTACAQMFYDSGGYGQMSVNGQSNECETVVKVFQTVPYCPITCGANPTAPGCAGCMNGGGGSF